MNKNKRSRGGQACNHNAFKHGLYSSRISPLSRETLANIDTGNIEEEIHIIRVMLSRHLKMRASQPPTSPEETLTDLRVISFAIARIASLLRLRKNMPSEE